LQVAAGIQQMLGNAEKWFGKFEVPVLIGSIIGLIIIILGHTTLGIWCLVLSQWSMQLFALFGRAWQLRKKDFHHAWILRHPGFRPHTVFVQLGHTLAYILATQTFAIRFKALLTLLPAGSLSVYGYAETVYARTSSLFLRPVSTVFFHSRFRGASEGRRRS
jgi:peptidoglycan biosynthesis protein MviN/MurJ (putative lipid II flippase)